MRLGRSAVALALAFAAAGAKAQTHTGHEAHMAQMAAASKDATVRLLAPQPVIPEASFLDQEGRSITLREALGGDQPVLLNFIFTTCTTICPVMSAGMAQFLSNLGEERERVRVVSVSIDPELDSVDVLRAYAARYHASSSWRFLTGSRAAVEAAQRAFGSYRGGKTNHTPGTFVRASADAPWIALDGFASAETLEHASMGHLVPTQQ